MHQNSERAHAFTAHMHNVPSGASIVARRAVQVATSESTVDSGDRTTSTEASSSSAGVSTAEPPRPSSSHAERVTSAGPDATSPTSTAAEVGAILDEVEAWLTQCGLGRIAPDAAWVAEWSEMHCYAEMARDPTARARFEDEMQLDATERRLLDTALQTRFNSGSGSSPAAVEVGSAGRRRDWHNSAADNPVALWLVRHGLGRCVEYAIESDFADMDIYEDMASDLTSGGEAEAWRRQFVQEMGLSVEEQRLFATALETSFSGTI